MNKINAIIIDDEEGCISNLKFYIAKYCPQVHITDTGSNADHLLNIVSAKDNIHLAFLDIELYKDDIFNILSKISKVNFDIIFVTAHEQYAIKAFRVNVLDYVLKPLKKADILSCYNKILRRYNSTLDNSDSNNSEKTDSTESLILTRGDKVYLISYKDVIYLKANGAYTSVSFLYKNENLIATVSKHLNKYKDLYPQYLFYRVHRSYIINIKKIASVLKQKNITVEMVDGAHIPVAKRRRLNFLSKMRADENS